MNKELQDQIKVVEKVLVPEGHPFTTMKEFHKLLVMFSEYLKGHIGE